MLAFLVMMLVLVITLGFNRVFSTNDWLVEGLAISAYVTLWTVLIWGLTRESFRWTHFPIRFNYRNRMVYVFCLDGVVRSAKWDDLFFTLGRGQRMPSGRYVWDIRGHALKADRETVEWTFALRGDSLDPQQLKHVWEFVRRYMEEGPASVYRDVLWCHDIATKKETFRAGLNVLFLMFNGLPILQWISAPMLWLTAVGRWFAMKTSKIPRWPADVEAKCSVDAFDPYRRTAAQNPAKIPTEPGSVAWKRIGS
ncbi:MULTISPECIES: DUF6708 domain-containing protein [unclassified Caballeronia]|uniref:DUF6708 domain-containing protein n=1 Tax=unclassified Caballeronia TaxID=2646786 RepID=UPI002862444C|nr:MULTISPECIES: DUF6708 domain-containing protein [unclassified Caballeronia]MDR5739549.1 hypothetical protein [Caballeronia sp. LZ016]MDR5808018.1 hypothetical protein [Caballeronia sp. LZ019]